MRLGTYFRKELLKNFDINASLNDIILDVGCFDGYWLSTQKAKEKYGIDINIKKKYKNIKYVKSSALEIPFKNSKFDKVYAFDIIEHLPKNSETKFLSELIRVTKKEGKIVLTFPSNSIKVIPSFMTKFVSNRWGHYKYLGLSRNKINEYLINFKDIKCKIIDLNTRNYLRFYFILRLLWFLNASFTKSIIKYIVKMDMKNLKGETGYYMIIIIKK